RDRSGSRGYSHKPGHGRASTPPTFSCHNSRVPALFCGDLSRRFGVRKSGALRIGIVLLLATVAAGVFALAGRADDPAIVPVSSSAKPGFINPNGDVLYNASWQDNDNRTFTHTRVEITIPAGWTLVSSAPSGCTRNGTLVT